MDAVVAEELEVRRGDARIVHDISFTARFGQVTALLGPNGAGKSTTIECCEGYLPPVSGSVMVNGFNPLHNQRRFAQSAGVMLQGGGLPMTARVGELTRLFCRHHGRSANRAESLLDQVGLRSRQRASIRTLSGGERQRLSLALALTGEPRILFLDEPTAGVDLDGKRLIGELIASLASSGAAILLSSHDLEEVEQLADRIVILDEGEIIAAGSTDELLNTRDRQQFEFRVSEPFDVGRAAQETGLPIVSPRPGVYIVDAPPDHRSIADLTLALSQQGVLIGDLRAGRERLTDLFAALTRESSSAIPRERRRR